VYFNFGTFVSIQTLHLTGAGMTVFRNVPPPERPVEVSWVVRRCCRALQNDAEECGFASGATGPTT
jgi:hypothetical protein